jgi:adenylosuccinate lyase
MPALRSLTVFASVALASAFACKDLQPLAPEAELNLCRAEALVPLVGSLDAAVQTVRDVNAGRVSLAEVVAQAKATRQQVLALVVALEKCEPAAPEGPASAPAEESL